MHDLPCALTFTELAIELGQVRLLSQFEFSSGKRRESNLVRTAEITQDLVTIITLRHAAMQGLIYKSKCIQYTQPQL